MELAGKKHNELFYPSFSGVAQSYNYYPVSYMERSEGVIFAALGLGKTIVDGEKSLRFSPKYPKILSQYYSIKSTINLDLPRSNRLYGFNTASIGPEQVQLTHIDLKYHNFNISSHFHL